MDNLKVSSGTIIRTIVLVVALINQILVMMGLNTLPFDEQQITDGLSMLFTAVASVWAWWKNNSFTKAAKAADAFLQNERGA